MKIAFFTGGLPLGGSTTFILYLADGLRELGISSEVFSFANGNPFAAEFSAVGIPVHTSDKTKFIFEDQLTALYQEVAWFKPTVAIANLATESYEMLRYLPAGVVRLSMIHDPINQGFPPIYRDSLDGVITVNPSWVEVTNQLSSGLPCKYLAHGIPHPESNLVRIPSPAEPLRLTYFGRLTEVKGAKLFPEIVKELHLRKVPFRWTIYGSGPDEDYLREHLAAEIKTREVVMSPFIPRDKLFENIRNHDVFIMASEVEGGPLTLLEAMAAGLVPICNDTPSLAQQVVTPENGFIIPREAAKYAETFSVLHQDRSRLERMSAAARKTITAQYGLKAMAERYVDFIKTLAPKQTVDSWPEKISPKAIRGLSTISQLSQSVGLARQTRRLIKRLRR